MLRRLCLTFAALGVLVGCQLALGQDTSSTNSPAGSTAPAGDEISKLQAENAALKQEVADAKHTISQLQAELNKAGIHHHAVTDSTPEAQTAAADATASTNAAPSGPLKALPLDAPNPALEHDQTATGTPAADAGPGKTYTVVKGDSLWKIAHKMYPGDTKNGVDKIQEANKDAIGGKPLKIGQVLIIPQ